MYEEDIYFFKRNKKNKVDNANRGADSRSLWRILTGCTMLSTEMRPKHNCLMSDDDDNNIFNTNI